MAISIDKKLSKMVDTIAKEIVSTEHFGAESMINTPLMYPSGASVIVQVTRYGEKYFVSDIGYGFQESEMIGASNFFQLQAKSLAEKFGIRFDNQSFFVTETTKEQLPGAVTVVANCSNQAVTLAVHKAAEKKYSDDAVILFDRIADVFPRKSIAKNFEIVGSSAHKWKFAAAVNLDNRQTIFEPVTNHYNSIVSASAKFHDISTLDNAPNRIAMVKSKTEMGDFLNLISQSASVVEYGVDNKTIERVAA